MARIVYLFIIFSIKATFGQDDCGLFGTVENRIKNCAVKYNDDFELLSKVSGKMFWYDRSTGLSWHSPRVLTVSNGSYKEIKKRCVRPYRLASLSKLKKVLQKDNPIERLSDFFVVRNFHTSRSKYDPNRDFVKKYFNFKTGRSTKNPTKKTIEDFQILCVADLENLYLFERSR